MEIDFLGLNSPRCELEQEKSKNTYIDAGVEISLSLSTSSSLNFSERMKSEFAETIISSSSCNGCTIFTSEKTEQLPSTLLLVAPPLFRHSSAVGGGGGFLYDLNDPAASVNLRNITQLSTEHPASLTMLYPTCPNVFTEPEKAGQNNVYISGNASKGGYTPTVAMARRATLARFLEKRVHRMKQAKASHIMGRSNNSEMCETKKINHLKRRS